MDITILQDRVLITRIKAETLSAGGLFVASAVAELTHTGLVLAVGEGRVSKEGVLLPLTVKVDDKVLYNITAGVPVKLDGQDFLVLKEDDIFAIIND